MLGRTLKVGLPRPNIRMYQEQVTSLKPNKARLVFFVKLQQIFGARINGFSHHSSSPVGKHYLLWRPQPHTFLESKTVQVVGNLKLSSVLLIIYLRFEVQEVRVMCFQVKATVRFAVVTHCFFIPVCWPVHSRSVDVYQDPHNVGSYYARYGKCGEHRVSNTCSQLLSRSQCKEEQAV